MKFLIIGLGSMGKRRIRNLRYLKAGEVRGWDPREDRRQEATEKYGITCYASLDEGMAWDPDALIISTPPDTHMPYAKLAAENGTHFFTEAGVTDDGLEEVIRLCENKPFTAAPSCTMRFHPSIKVIKDLVDQETIGDILTATYHCGQYLPDWHPWEDYTTFYAAQRETGACREIVAFELVWLTWVLGGISLVSCFKDKLTKLDIDIDDAYHMLLRFKGGCMANYLVEVVSRQPIRHVRLMSEQGIIEWVQSEKAVRLYEKKTDQWRTFNEPAPIQEPGYVFAENMYIDEMRAFVESCTGIRPYPYSYTEDRIILKTLYACETSMLDGRHLDVSALYG